MYYIQKSSEEKKLFVSEFLGLSASRKCDSNLRRCVKSVDDFYIYIYIFSFLMGNF